MSVYPATVCVLVILASAACTSGKSRTAGSAVRDSAGIVIVDDAAPQLDSAHAWRLTEEPSLAIGGSEATGPSALFRVGSATKLSDGRVVAVDGASAELRYFDAEGRYLGKAGGKGDGPGEFRLIGGLLVLPGDTLAVFDFGGRGITLLGPDGRFVRMLELPSDVVAGGFMLRGRLPDGSLVGTGGKNAMYLGLGDGLHWGQGWMSRISPDGTETRLLEFESGEIAVAKGGRQSGWAPFFRSRQALLAGNQVVLADNTDYELRYYDPEGGLDRIARRAYQPRPVTTGDVDSFTARLDQTPMKGMMDGIAMPPTWPTFVDGMVDALGNVWIESERPVRDTGPVTWSVFDPQGVWITDVQTPEQFGVKEIGADYILGVGVDDMETEQVRMYGLIKGQG